MRGLPPPARSGTREAAWLTLGLWTAVYIVFLIPSVAEHGRIPAFHFALHGLIVASGLCLSSVVYLAVRLTRGLNQRTRIGLIGGAALGVAGLQSGSDAVILRAFIRAYDPIRLADFPFAGAWAMSLLIYVWLYGLYAAVLGLLLSNLAVQDRERQLALAKAEAHQAQLAALRFQLNPHFLFNTLNAISSLIVTGRNGEAEAMTDKLSDFLRASLAADPQNLIPLHDELAQVGAYLDIERVRFGERMAIDVVCPEALHEAAVPSFILQPLVENAVKYAVAPARRRVQVRVEVSERDGWLQILVEDDGDGAEPGALPLGAGVGLENVRRRLETLYGERAKLEAGRMPGGGYRAALKFPHHPASAAKVGRAA